MTIDQTIPLTVDTTAIVVAMSRLEESLEPDPLIFDPYIMILLGKQGIKMARNFFTNTSLSPKQLQQSIALRQKYGDELCANSDIEQVVILAAGLDTRAWRLNGIQTLFEIDRSDIFKEKCSRLPQPTCKKHISITADLIKDDWKTKLLDNGFQPHLKTAWLAEGLLMYLKQSEINKLLHCINTISAIGSRIFFDQIITIEKSVGFAPLFASRSSVETFDEDFKELFADGWEVVKYRNTGVEFMEFGRVFEPSKTANGELLLSGFFVHLEKQVD